MKKYVLFLLQITLIFFSYFVTQLIVLGTKSLLPKGINQNYVLIYQLLILPTTLLWVNFYLKKMSSINIKFNNYSKSLTKISFAFIIVFLIHLISIFYNYNYNHINFKIFQNDCIASKWVIFILIIFCLAFSEELIFRCLVLNITFKITQNIYVIAIINGILFLVLHAFSFLNDEFQIIWSLGIFCMGFFTSIYVLKFKDLIFPVFFHTFWNISTSLFVEGEKYKFIEYSNFENNEELIGKTTTLIMCICLIIFTVFCVYFDKIINEKLI